MPTRKQRRRREKSFRHEWEYVEIDPESGEERQVAPSELRPEKKEKRREPTAKAGDRGGAKARQTRGGRTPQPPSWRRVWKRTALFAPLMALFIYWTQSGRQGGVSLVGLVLNTAILIAFFGPFSYLVDSMTYRIWSKRAEKQ